MYLINIIKLKIIMTKTHYSYLIKYFFIKILLSFKLNLFLTSNMILKEIMEVFQKMNIII